MSWFSKLRRQKQAVREARGVPDALLAHLEGFIASRKGVEAWLEQPTNFNKASILLVAVDGESTRRAIPSAAYGYELAARHGIPCYAAGVVPYPQRMRDYEQRAKREC